MRYSTTISGDKIVTKDLQKIIAAAKEGEFTSLILFGSFGRGEGYVDEKPHNDYDLLLVDGDEKCKKALTNLDMKCMVEVHAVTMDEVKKAMPTQQWYEIAHASQVLAGKTIAFPAWEAYEIPYFDALNSIDRRITSHIIAKFELMKENPDYRKVQEQLNKLIIAIGDATLIKRGVFHPKYTVRAMMLAYDEIGDIYQLAVSTKLLGYPELVPDKQWELWHDTKNRLRQYMANNQVQIPKADVLFSITDRTTHKQLAEVIKQLGASDWL